MKKSLIIFSTLLSILSSCGKTDPSSSTPSSEEKGTLSFADLQIGCDIEVDTKASASAPGNYAIFIYDETDSQIYKTTYSQVQGSEGISLIAGDYTFEARSIEEQVPAASFESPVYGVRRNFSITAGQTTDLGTLTCTLLQCKVTVDYDDAFLNDVTGDCNTEVTVTAGAPLVYELNYSDGQPTYDRSAGYFAVNNGANTTMTVIFRGKIQGKSQKMTASLTGIQPRQWRQITFYKKVDAQGTATFQIGINNFVDDEELVIPMTAVSESVIGDDPDAPQGDGGITMAFADGCPYTDFNDISVPDPEVGTFNLGVTITVPNGIKKFIVDISSDNESFISSVALTGSTRLDLINPLPSQSLIFDIVPFPHGQDLLGKNTLTFDLSAAQEPIFIFKGHHTFTMNITDQEGCKKSFPVVFTVQ